MKLFVVLIALSLAAVDGRSFIRRSFGDNPQLEDLDEELSRKVHHPVFHSNWDEYGFCVWAMGECAPGFQRRNARLSQSTAGGALESSQYLRPGALGDSRIHHDAYGGYVSFEATLCCRPTAQIS